MIIRYTPAIVTNQISGNVFRDYDADGTLDAGEAGVSGIHVTAYDSSNNPVDQGGNDYTTTDSSGNYTLTGLTDTETYRIEFTNVPSYLKPGPIGIDSQSTVVFIESPASDVDLGLQNPGEYIGSGDPEIVNSISFAGDTQAGSYSAAGTASIVGINYDASGTNTSLAPIEDVGSTWGIAYQRSTNTIFAAASLRRSAGFGSIGPGGIYIIDRSSPGSASPWLDLDNDLGISTGTVTRSGSADYTLPAQAGESSWDIDAYAKVGKMSLGDIDFDEVDRTLWIINLFDMSLYGIQNVDPGTTPTMSDVLGPYAIDDASIAGIDCTSNGELRPWGLKVHQGKVYVGAVCTSEYADTANLSGHVLEFDPENAGAGFTDVLDIDFTDSAYEHPMVPTETPEAGHISGDGWQTWYYVEQFTSRADMSNYVSGSTYKARYAVPIVSDIEFDDDGNMIIGVRSRFGMMQAQHEYAPDSGNTDLVDEVVGAGDILRACLVSGSYVLEGTSGCTASTTANGDGPGGTEFFADDDGPGGGNFWPEEGIGAVALLPRSGEVVTTTFDPIDYYQNGLEWFSTTDGSQDRSYDVYTASEVDPPDYGLPLFGKGNGLGDIELLIPPPPIEIGNRVWEDTNHNGIQDADEPGIENVVVGLYDNVTSAELDQATTDSEGNYLFSSDTSKTTTASRRYGLSIDSVGEYALVILESNYNTGGPLDGYIATTSNADSPSRTDNDAVTDNHDSDGVAVTVGSDPIGVTFTNQGTGADNHSFDFGFYYMPTVATIGQVTLEPTSVGDFLSGLDVSSMDTGALTDLLQKWDPYAASSLGAASHAQLVDALTSYLDPDGDGKVAVFHWDTLEERGTIGFYVERQEGTGDWSRINNDLLPGLINAPMGAEYQLADPGAVSGQVYQYRLIEQEAAGSTRTYGPFTVEMP